MPTLEGRPFAERDRRRPVSLSRSGDSQQSCEAPSGDKILPPKQITATALTRRSLQAELRRWMMRSESLKRGKHSEPRASFMGLTSSQPEKHLHIFKWFYNSIFFSSCGLPSCVSESERNLAGVEMSTLRTKTNSLQAGGCEGHLFATSDPASCSRPAAKPSLEQLFLHVFFHR